MWGEDDVNQARELDVGSITPSSLLHPLVLLHVQKHVIYDMLF